MRGPAGKRRLAETRPSLKVTTRRHARRLPPRWVHHQHREPLLVELLEVCPHHFQAGVNRGCGGSVGQQQGRGGSRARACDRTRCCGRRRAARSVRSRRSPRPTRCQGLRRRLCRSCCADTLVRSAATFSTLVAEEGRTPGRRTRVCWPAHSRELIARELSDVGSLSRYVPRVGRSDSRRGS